MERHSARAVYLIRDHNPFHDKQNKYRPVFRLKTKSTFWKVKNFGKSSTSRYVFLPYVNDVIQEDADKLDIGIVSSFFRVRPKESDLLGMLKTHEKYTAELNESQKSGKSRTKSFEGTVSKLFET